MLSLNLSDNCEKYSEYSEKEELQSQKANENVIRFLRKTEESSRPEKPKK